MGAIGWGRADMNGFQHLNLNRGQVKIRRDGRRLRIAIAGDHLSRLTVEIEDGDLTLLDTDDAALAPQPQKPERTP